MLTYAVIFLVISVIAVIFGFGVVAGVSATIAKVLFALFLILFIVILIFGNIAV